jgi:hypothetical protein
MLTCLAAALDAKHDAGFFRGPLGRSCFDVRLRAIDARIVSARQRADARAMRRDNVATLASARELRRSHLSR